jgi:cytochrome b subunit of formate dehydrogenase
MPARTNQEMIRICSVCHSNEAIRAEFELPDSSATYLASFHGKGTLLGDETTADCLECHVGPQQNVHQIESHLESGAPTSQEKLPDTCRSPQCHPQAGKDVGSAAIHLQLATSRGVEYFIAGVFVLLIIFTFGPSALLLALEMLQLALGRHDPVVHKNHQRAEKMLANQRSRKLLKRFTPFQRVQHWFLVLTFVTLVLTGYPMKFADRAWAAWLVELMGGLSVARIIHRIAGAALLTGFLYHFIIYVGGYILKEKKRTGQSYFRTILQLPLLMTPSDFKRMGQYLLFLFGLRKHRPQWGRFSLEEKFEYIGVVWGTILLGVTGIIMWDDSFTSRYVPGRVLTVSNLIHSFESYLALLHVGIVHLAGVLLKPGVFPCSLAMFTGDTPAEELAEVHPALLDEVEQKVPGRLDNGIQDDQDHHRKPKHWARRLLHDLRLRIHALIVMLIVSWAAYSAVALLIRSVFLPTHIPPRLLEWQGHLEADALWTSHTLGITADAPRAPMGHYHGVDRWFQADPHNTCAAKGCHSPMPHNRIAAVRAFDNFHATFLECQLCHEYKKESGKKPVWISMATGQPQGTPAILQLMQYLELNAEQIKADPAQAHITIMDHLQRTMDTIGEDPLLEYIHTQIDTSEPGSPVWYHAVDQLTSEIPYHARGEYGAKLTPNTNGASPQPSAGERQNPDHQMKKLTQQYLKAPPDSLEQKELYEKIHSSLLEKPHKCLACHTQENPMLDFESLGYTPSRVETLQGSSIASQMQKIQQGQRFRLKTPVGANP